MKWLRELRLKKEARELYLKIQQRSDMSCGAHLADMVRPDIAQAEQRFREVMLELAEIDPAAKKLIETEGLPFGLKP